MIPTWNLLDELSFVIPTDDYRQKTVDKGQTTSQPE
jgi:hypothetical protein